MVVVKWSACSPYTSTIQLRIPLTSTYNFSVKLLLKKTKNKQKLAWFDQFKEGITYLPTLCLTLKTHRVRITSPSKVMMSFTEIMTNRGARQALIRKNVYKHIHMGLWWWLSRQSGRFQFQRSVVRIQSSAKIILNIYCQLY